VKEHGALCVEIVGAKELGTLFDELLSLECFDESHLTPGLGEACGDACGLEGVGLAVVTDVLVGEAYRGTTS
jgi:hypothetical protein